MMTMIMITMIPVGLLMVLKPINHVFLKWCSEVGYKAPSSTEQPFQLNTGGWNV